jgi:photosystem II stability/assembly factor-like uncharacterized protein
VRDRASTRGRVSAITLAILAAWLLAAPADAGFNAWSSNGPPDVSILSLAVDPLTPGIVYAGSNGNGIFRSKDGGASWVPVNTGLTNPIVGALAVHPFGTGIVYAGTNGGGVFRSLDGGESWAPVNTGLGNGVVTALAINPVVPTTLYAGVTGQGVFKSVDGGESWAAINVGLTNFVVTALAVNPVNTNVVYVGTTGDGVFRSFNAGGSWAAASSGLVNTLVSALAINPVTPAILYAGTTGGGVFRSADGGTSWAPVNDGITNVNTIITSLVIDPRTPNILYASAPGTGVFRTINAGSSWALFNAGLTNTVVNALAITPAGACVHAATRGTGVFDFAFNPTGCAPVAVAAAVLPSSRSVLVNAVATAFATIVNPAPSPALGCGIALLGALPAVFSFQTTDPTTNQVTGSPNVAVDIGAQGLQTYVIALTPSAPIGAADVRFNFGCATSASAPIITGVNTLLLSASTTPAPDIVALAASDGGIVNIPGTTGTGVFAVATINLGAGDTITASADTGAITLPLSLAVCETDAAGACLVPPGPPVTRVINPGDTPTFGIFVRGTAFIPFDPAAKRIFVRFKDSGGRTRGSTSVAVRTQP